MGKPVGVQVPLRAPFEDPPGLNRQADFFMPDLNLFAAVFFLATAYYPLCRLAPGSLAYQGLLPELFREGQGVVAEGVLAAPDQMRAETILAKHDERYMPREVVDALKKQGRWQEGTTATQ